MMKRICVFCGSSSGVRPVYTEQARQVGRLLLERGAGLVYGGGNVGLMGVIADTVLEGGGEVIGVIPRALVQAEVAHAGLTDLRVVDTMHERKALMAQLSDAFIAMPGGYGTLEEFAEVLTWAQLGLHRKAFGLLNVDGYYSPLLAFFDMAVEQGFVSPANRSLVVESDDARTLLAKIDAFKPSPSPKYIVESEV